MMRGMSADDYPDLPMVERMTLKLQPERLVQALKGTLFASSADAPSTTGVHLKFNQRLRTATDGHRLAVLNVDDVADAAVTDAVDDQVSQ